MKRLIVYISGPYSAPDVDGVAANIQRAEEAAKLVWKIGHVALCPHLNTAHFEIDGVQYEDYITGDLLLVEKCDVVLMLPGHAGSRGAVREREHAVLRRIPVVTDIGELKAIAERDDSVLREAQGIVEGARRYTYGTPLANHSRTAAFWQSYLTHPITAEQVCFMNILQKIARSMERPSRDNLVDIAGYAENIHLVEQERRS